MADNYNTYYNPHNFVIGSIFYSVQSVTVSVTYAEIHGAGDDDTVENIARYATATVRGTITLLDPAQADTIKGSTGTLSFDYTDAQAGSDLSVSIANASS